MPVRPMLLRRMAFVSFDCFVKIWATCNNFLGKWFTVPPLAENCPYAYEQEDQCSSFTFFNVGGLRRVFAS